MGECQRVWIDPADFKLKRCGAETDREHDGMFECRDCFKRESRIHRKVAEKMTCPLCWQPLEMVPAKEMHEAHQDYELARKCTGDGCVYICFMGDEGPREDIDGTP